MDSFLQTNNDLIISIHKALVESTQEINRKIESLRDDVRDVKLSLAKNDRIMQEEATNWRRHTETIVKELGDRHQSDISGLHKLLMELCIRASPAPLVQPAVTATKPTKEEEQEVNKSVVPPVASAAVAPPAPAPEADNKSVVMPVVSTAVTAAPASLGFSFKAPTVAVTTASTTLINATSTIAPTIAPSAPIGGSLFGGGFRPGTNTFANLAAKAGKPQFGQPFFGTASDFKLFQQPPSQQMFSSNTHATDKTVDEPYKGDDGSDKEDGADEFVPDVHYEPVVPLPPEVEVSTGEEEEEVMFSARCKLYRFDKETRENKERGLGDIKLLYNPRSNRYRCVMRREQVFKLCANFPIYPDLKIHPREHMPTVYTWACKDFSDEPAHGIDVTLSARFKDKAIADEFYEKMMEAVGKSD